MQPQRYKAIVRVRSWAGGTSATTEGTGGHRGRPGPSGLPVRRGFPAGPLASILVDPGDTVVTEGPTYRGAIQAFQSVGARIICVPTDGDGIDVEALESVLAYTKPKLIYVVPT
ncbi:MAG: hypothetical protein QME77_13260, partial [bacterium]|nr:hypothetical protein [bacterium]